MYPEQLGFFSLLKWIRHVPSFFKARNQRSIIPPCQNAQKIRCWCEIWTSRVKIQGTLQWQLWTVTMNLGVCTGKVSPLTWAGSVSRPLQMAFGRRSYRVPVTFPGVYICHCWSWIFDCSPIQRGSHKPGGALSETPWSLGNGIPERGVDPTQRYSSKKKPKTPGYGATAGQPSPKQKGPESWNNISASEEMLTGKSVAT